MQISFRSNSLGCIVFFLLIMANLNLPAQNNSNTQTDEEEETDLIEFQEDSIGRNTPRGTVSGFISAVADQDYTLASHYLNITESSGEGTDGEELAQILQRLLDQGYLLPFARINNENSGESDDPYPAGIDYVGTVTADDESIDILVEATTGEDGAPIWLFASETIQNIVNISTTDNELFVNRILPDSLKENYWFGVPVGHWVVMIILMAFAYFIAWTITHVIRFLVRMFWTRSRVDPTAGVIKALAFPIGLYLSVWLFVYMQQQAGISIVLRQRLSGLTLIIGIIALIIFLWQITGFIGSYSQKRMVKSGNSAGVSVVLFLQRAAKIFIGIIAVIAVLGIFGIDVTAGLAALGIGGIALALGVQKTVENFVGSVTLITDQPIRVGDFCRVGDVVGTVERIGMRSTRIRTTERTLITIPNGQFSSENIENFAYRDRFLFAPALDLRYETTPDQIRYLLVEIRKMLYAHPMVFSGPRIRFAKLDKDALKLEVFSYINTSNFDVSLEVQEDLLLRIMDLVEKSGTTFAFPSQTIYMAADPGLSEEQSKAAEEKVKEWQQNKELQIPQFDPDYIEQLKNTITYPPEGSVKQKE